MLDFFERFLNDIRPAFSRKATFAWFVLIFAGFILRADAYGVSSIVRALSLNPACYPAILHFFHSSAWDIPSLSFFWYRWLLKQNLFTRIGNTIVLIGDHTNAPKDGRRIPAVETLRQTSETATKPSYFRGHQWGMVAALCQAGNTCWATPLYAETQKIFENDSRVTRMVSNAASIARKMSAQAYLVLDAYFASGPAFLTAQKEGNLHILTRAKKNIIAYLPPAPQPSIPRRGRPPIYGEKLNLMSLFDSAKPSFSSTSVTVYQKQETIRYLVLNLLWRPIAGKLRFFLFETSRGRIILLSSDLDLEPLTALKLYCRRITIETLFHSLKHTLCGMAYHFWSKYLERTSRKPPKKGTPAPISSQPDKTRNTLAAIEKFLFVQMILLGFLQHLACRFPGQIRKTAHFWMRTTSKEIPSEFVTKISLANLLKTNFSGFHNPWICQFILEKQNPASYNDGSFLNGVPKNL